MLRRRLLTRIGILVLGFVAGAVVAIALLQGVLRDLDAMSADAATLIDGVVDLNQSVADVDIRASELRLHGVPDPAGLAGEAERLRKSVARLGAHPLMQRPGAAAESFARIEPLIGAFLREAGALAPVDPPAATAREMTQASMALRQEAATLGREARAHVAAEQLVLSRNLRTLIVGLTIAALIMVNITIVVLLRTGQMILRPVTALVEGSRELARERFDHRVRLDAKDEFGELAHAYNRLAEQLRANEARKMETLQQLAVTLNHELNNVINVIELQLRLMDRRAGGDPAFSTHLRQVRENLSRIAQTVASLKDVRRIVLTDYAPGQKMLDLRESARDAAPPTAFPGAQPTVVVKTHEPQSS